MSPSTGSEEQPRLSRIFHSLLAPSTLILSVHTAAVPIIALLVLMIRGHGHMMDMSIYHGYSTDVVNGLVPYRDFEIEYPPLALLPLLLPEVLGLGHALVRRVYILGYLGESVALSAIMVFCLLRLTKKGEFGRTPAALAMTYVGLAIVLAPLLPWRYDLFPALLTLLAFLALTSARPGLAGVLVGAGAVAKIYPAALLPVFGALFVARRDLRSLAKLLFGAAATVALSMAPWLFIAQGKALSFVSYNRVRGLQVESIPAGILLIAYKAGLLELDLAQRFRSTQVISPTADLIAAISPTVLLAAMIAVTVLCFLEFRRRHREEGGVSAASVASASCAMIAVFIVFNKVLSPQYMIWLLPFVPFLPRRRVILAFSLCALTMVNTFFFNVEQPGMPIVLLLNLRNIMLMVLAAWLIRDRLVAPTQG